MSSDSDDDGSTGRGGGGSADSCAGGGFGFDLTGILFGNIDSEGKLVDDDNGNPFDPEFREHISSLSKLGLNSMLNEVIETEKDELDEADPPKHPMSDFDALKAGFSSTDGNEADNEDDGEIVKHDNAIDYSDINELSEDCPRTPPPNDANMLEDLEDAIPATKVETSSLTKDDKELMPPPLAPIRSVSTSSNNVDGSVKANGPDSLNSETKSVKPTERKLDTPLADMLPSKYANVDVRELFPDFRPDKVLRFSRLFGPGKPSSLPQIWRSVKKRRRRRKHSRDQKNPNAGSDSTSDSEEPKKKGFGLHYGLDAMPYQCMSDDEDKLLSITNSEDVKPEGPESGENNENKPKIADWRYGPAQIWYDMLDVPDSGEGFNYGFKNKHMTSQKGGVSDSQAVVPVEDDIEIKGEPIADDAFLMVSQLHWEDEVVWDGNDIKAKVLQKLNSKTIAAGWLPSSGSRTAGAFSQPGKTMPVSGNTQGGKQGSGGTSSSKKASQIMQSKPPEAVDDTWYSIFPVENEELIYGKWEDEIIWDAEQMTKVPKPKVLTLDPNDENIILGIPDDIDPSKISKNTGPPPKIKIPHPHVKKSKILLGKAGVINVLAEDTPPPPPKSPDRDPFNISNDSYYQPKTEPTLRLKVGGGNLIQHSTPVVELRSPFIPTYMGPMKLRAFHRPPLKRFSHGPLASPGPHAVLPLLKYIAKKAKQRELERIASGGGDVFFMRNPEDLSGKDGDIILCEFCEEHPPLMNQVGMCSKIKNYYKRKAAKDNGPQDFKYGEVAFAHTSPFLGILHPGHCIQALENNMYRAPIYPHNINPTDFLVIRNRSNYWIRAVNALFTVGQECPIYEVPGPNSKRANNFTRDFLQVFIYRLFWKSRDNPRRIRMDDIKRAFPAHSESSIRKRLKQCADFKRTGMDSNWWVIKPEFRLPSEEEIRAMVSPEQCCAFFSMIAAEQRLKDAGYGEKFLFAPQEDDDEEAQLKLDDEVKVAPWNTTRAYIQAMRGKCLLQLTGPADPTGCGEGFSYVRVPNKPTQTKEEQESQPKRTVTGTDADLRRLPLQRAKELLRKFKVPEEEIRKLSRWEVIDVVRTLSTEKAKAGEQGMDKFSRGNRFSIAEHQERYKEECQRIFDLQNRVLASSEVLSTDEDESSASEESDLEELGKNLENMLSNKKTSTQLSLEREEQEREELLKKIMEDQEGGKAGKSKDGKDENSQQPVANPNQGRILKITRTFKDHEGKEYTRVEIVRRQPVIDAYVKIRTTKDEQFIKQFATLDEQQKEEMKREKRRIQEQLRRIKRNQERERLALLAQNQKLQPGGMPTSLGDPKSSTGSSHKERDTPHKEVSPSRKKFKLKPDLKLKCGACGQVGHMRTNKACPLYTGLQGPSNSTSAAVSEEQEEEIDKEVNCEDDDLVNVDGTKVTLSSKLLKRHEDVRRRTLLLKVPKEGVGKKKRRMAGDLHCDYLQRQNKTANRRRTDPVVVLSSILEEILNELRSIPDVTPFLFPVNAKLVPDYYRIVTKPMDLQTMRDYIRQRRYHNREEFLADLNQIVENSTLYNGARSSFTVAAQRMLQSCFELLAEKEDKLMRLEKAINPLLDDDDQVALSFIFEQLHGKIKLMQESWPFLKPVNKKQVRDYYTVIKRPMDLESIGKNVEAHRYHSRAEFLMDIELIASNCEQYNGSESRFTKNAKVILNYARTQLEEFSEHCAQLEQNISKVQERARADAELDDTWCGDDQDYDFPHRTSRSSTPENDFIDVEGNERPTTSAVASASSSALHRSFIGGITIPAPTQPGGSVDMAPPPPDVKRGRGRPRKQRDTVEEVKVNASAVKRGRGRPRKDSLASNISNPQNSFLEEDLQCSTDDEEFQEVSEDENNAANILDQGERMQANSCGLESAGVLGVDQIDVSHIKTEMKIEPPQLANEEEGVEQQCEDDSQQAAEAMVQLSGVGFYTQQQQDDSMDLDPNYDPSDFLNFGNRATSNNNTDDLQASQSQIQYTKDDEQLPDGPMSGDMPSMPQMSLIMPGNDNVGIDEDLAISESDEEDGGGNATMKSEVFNDSGEMANDGMDTNMIAGSAVSQDNEVPMNVDTSKQEQHHQHDDNDDDDWLHF
ncbi:PREDICTED: transcription initiation factor TFIID subunit 1 isoform X2 [Rhagoletis zephyria]|uniref:transcription initiation factor TFIID subunit 1 isoform X1 n=1 Tax=Rhagoletis zephyria TaxID=28612 RepID=UPI000811A6E6|nr:PREDICTED: transcription initiation factor TFIID subunit 1 isoform X1 [Rhagoletis zephyria]XP_017474030.1 PREDICTED: transcription initiation factor TFIID subunit 1 isoform X2 [Rhagoletis zephyria]